MIDRDRLGKRAAVLLALLPVALLASAAPAAAGVGDVPTPTVAPIPATAGSTPFLAVTDPEKLARNNYVEEEFSLSGGAFKWDTVAGADGTKVTDGPNADGSYPYMTRILVRRPERQADFNGNVVVEWFNVTGGFDLEYAWGAQETDLMREGYAWVGVSAQVVGIDFLAGWFRDPTRYADLSGASGVDRTDRDRASYDIFSQAAKAIRGAGAGPDPMGSLDPQMLIATGASQSGGRLNRYYDSIQSQHQVIDSFLITVANGTLRDDLDAKVLRLLSEREARFPSDEVDNDSYRRWEVAGSSHVPEATGRYWEPLQERDLVSIPFNCAEPPLSAIQYGEVNQAALEALIGWENGGPPPPIAPRMRYDAADELLRDEHGIAAGGIALPDVTVPVATNSSFNEPAPGATDPFSIGFCRLLGSHLPFSEQKLAGLYDDFGDYVDRQAAAADAVLAQGFITPEGADRLEGAAATFPRLRPERPRLGPIAETARIESSKQRLSWRGPAGQETAFKLQHREKGGGWSGVPGAGKLAKADFPLRKERREGTYAYRVKASTDVPPASYRELSGQVIRTPYSEPLRKVKIDRSGPKRPRIKLRGERLGGVFLGEVEIEVVGRKDRKLRDGSKGSGLNPRSVPKPETVDGAGTYTVRARTTDRAGNRSKLRRVRFEIG